MKAASSYEIVDIETQPVTLEEVFLAYYGRNNRRNQKINSEEEGAYV